MSRKHAVRCICHQCSKEYDNLDYRPNRPQKYCSRACRDEAQRTRVLLTCRQCGKEFHRKAYMADWSQERGPFCGFACYGIWQRRNLLGPDHPSFVPTSPCRGSAQWTRNRILVLERDGKHCVACGSANRLHVHHIREWNQADPSTHAMDNLVTLCASCHRKAHPMRHRPDGKFQPIR